MIMTKEMGAMLKMLLCACLWSIAGIIIKLVDMNPFAIAGLRSLFAAATVAVFMRLTSKRVIVNKKTLLGAVFLCATFIAFVSANKLTTAANAIVLQFTAPVFVMIIEGIILRKKPRFFDMATVFVTLGGISLFFIDSLGSGKITGDTVAVFAGLFLAFFFFVVGESQGDEKISGILFGQILTAVIGLPFLFFTENTVNAQSVAWIAVLGVFQLGIPYILLAEASKYCPALACSLISVAEPLLNPVWVAIFYHEIPGAMSLFGGVIVISAVTFWCIFKDKFQGAKA